MTSEERMSLLLKRCQEKGYPDRGYLWGGEVRLMTSWTTYESYCKRLCEKLGMRLFYLSIPCTTKKYIVMARDKKTLHAALINACLEEK